MTSKYNRFLLKNGIEVIHYPIKEVRAVTFSIGLSGGSAYEKEGDVGTLHYLEHVLLSGNRTYKNTKELALQAEKIGTTYNGGVGLFDTQYWYTSPDSRFEEMVEFAAGNLLHPLFSKKDIEKSRNIILSEYDSYWDVPDNQFVMSSYMTQLGEKHPYTRRGIGDRKTIETMTKKKLIDTYERYYVPQNMKIVVVGSVTYKKTQEIVKKHFASVIGEDNTINEPKPELPLNKSSYLVFNQPRNQIKMGISYFLNGGSKELSIKKKLAINMVSFLLGGGRTSLLNQHIREEKGLVYGIGSKKIMWPFWGAIEIWSTVPVEKLLETFTESIKIVESIKNNGVKKNDFKRVRTYLSMRTLLNYSSVSNIADDLLFSLLDDGKIILPEEYVKIANTITHDYVNKTAQEMFDASKMSLHMLGDEKLIEKTKIRDRFDKYVYSS